MYPNIHSYPICFHVFFPHYPHRSLERASSLVDLDPRLSSPEPLAPGGLHAQRGSFGNPLLAFFSLHLSRAEPRQTHPSFHRGGRQGDPGRPWLTSREVNPLPFRRNTPILKIRSWNFSSMICAGGFACLSDLLIDRGCSCDLLSVDVV
jgi:hypothetical protein